jgi:hypothetical protein
MGRIHGEINVRTPSINVSKYEDTSNSVHLPLKNNSIWIDY